MVATAMVELKTSLRAPTASSAASFISWDAKAQGKRENNIAGHSIGV